MNESTIWWMITGVAVAVELVTGTFYLLMMAVGLSAGALAAYIGWGVVTQMLAAAAVGGGSVLVWHGYQRKSTPPLRATANRDVNIDIGESIQVDHWNADGTATVKFRGASWTAVAADNESVAQSGQHRICEMIGNRLIIKKI
jgi:membrane protein implicated in regulation of membrane protease activity